jgi:hypothetical protein
MRTACAGTVRRTGTSEDPVNPACVPRRVLGSAAAFPVAAASLPAREDERGWYRPLALTSGVAAVACLGVGAARPTPLVLGLALVLLLSIPWGFAVARRLAGGADPPGTARRRGVWFGSGVTRLATASGKMLPIHPVSVRECRRVV